MYKHSERMMAVWGIGIEPFHVCERCAESLCLGRDAGPRDDRGCNLLVAYTDTDAPCAAGTRSVCLSDAQYERLVELGVDHDASERLYVRCYGGERYVYLPVDNIGHFIADSGDKYWFAPGLVGRSVIEAVV